MQTTLLALGIAIILALVAALVGPYFIDWSSYRAQFEARGSEFTGVPVRIRGDIDMRLLPIPSLTLHDVQLQPSGAGATLRAHELNLVFALGPLMRGNWRATEARIEGADVRLRLDRDGTLSWPARKPGFDPESLSIDKLAIRNGRLIFGDAASGSRATLAQFSFDGEARSLLGPIRGEGSFVVDGHQHTFRIVAGRAGADGEVKLRLALERPQQSLALDADGSLSFPNGAPHFAGSMALSRRAGVVLVEGRALTNEPWRIAAKVEIAPESAQFEQLDLAYGPPERALKLGGSARIAFGRQPVLETALSAPQLDVDRFVALPEATRRLPAFALSAAAGMLEAAILPPMPLRVGLGIDTVTLAGAVVHDVRGNFRFADGGWEIERVQFRAPGATRVHASGRLAATPQGYAFSGPADVEATDPRTLGAWLEGRRAPVAALAAPLRASGQFTLTPHRFAIEGLQAEINRKPVSGQLVYQWPSPSNQRPRLEAAINAAELDIDAATQFIRTALPGAGFDLPGEAVLALDIGRATLAGIEAARVEAKLRLDADGMALDRVAIGDLAGASFTLKGHVATPWEAPSGTVTAEIEDSRLDGLAALLEKVAARPAQWLRAQGGRIGPAKLRAKLTLERAPAQDTVATARLTVEGNAGPLRVAWNGEASGSIADWSKARLSAQGRIDADNGALLMALAGLDGWGALDRGAGALRWKVAGSLADPLAIEGQLSAPGAELTAKGTLGIGADAPVRLGARISARFADAAVVRQALGRPAQPAPGAFKAQVALEGDHLTLTDLHATLGDSTLGGELALTLGTAPRVNGRLEADRLDLAALFGALVGMPQSADQAAAWPHASFGSRLLGEVAGRIALAASRARLTSALEIRGLRSTLQFAPGEATLEDVEGTLAGGRVQAGISVQSTALGTAASGRIALTGADLAALWPQGVARGRLTLQLDAKGNGRSPAALMSSLGGSGTISLERLALPGLAPDVFQAVMRATDQAGNIEPDKVQASAEAALGNSPLNVPRTDGSLTLLAGQLRLGALVASSERADLAVSATIDLVRGTLEARLALLGPAEKEFGASAGRPEVDVNLQGPLAAPRRSVDTSALLGWLTLRAVDLQAQRVKEAEAERRRAEEALRRMNEENARRAAEEAAARRAAEETMRPPAAPESAAKPTDNAAEDGRPAAAPAPKLPAPIDIRPAPGARRSNTLPSSPQASAAPERVPPPAAFPIPERRSVLDFFFNSPR